MEIDEKAVASYNAIFRNELEYKTQSVVNWNLRPDILIHGSPCQDFSIAGRQEGADEGTETRSSLMWETINIIKQMGEWKPKIVIWENVKNVLSKHMRHNFNRYLTELECWRLQGYDDTDYYKALAVHLGREGCLNGALYKQAGNSIPIPIFESMFKQMI